jgi:hypothetical protein
MTRREKACPEPVLEGDDGTVIPSGDLLSGEPAAQSSHILREFLDGEAHREKFGFLCETAERFLHVPFRVTDSPLAALLLCRERGLLRAKLDKMVVEDTDYLAATTLVKPTLEN